MISHAYLFAGPAHLGKFSVALEFAGKLAGVKDGKMSPNMVVVSPEVVEKKGVTKELDIKVEHIRELQRRVNMTAQDGKYKVAIIDGADKLTKAAQNALLKTLEEPPEKTILILIVEDLEKILPTILSRCQTKKFGLVPLGEMDKMISGEARNKEELIFWSLGRPGLLVGFLENGEKLEKGKETLSELNDLLSLDLGGKFALAEKMSKNYMELVEKMNIWQVIFRGKLNRGAGRALLKNNISREKAFYLINEIEKSLALLKGTNANPRLVLENLFLKF
ncbi:MAG: polymerase subunit delta [Patescibacteria group bacterium]|nr:polymerase subunit delta [Patescibacteria group bacterium]